MRYFSVQVLTTASLLLSFPNLEIGPPPAPVLTRRLGEHFYIRQGAIHLFSLESVFCGRALIR
jgi:hypothetical protein